MKITVGDKDGEWIKWKVVNFDGTEITCTSFDDETKECVIPLMNRNHQIIQDIDHGLIYVTVKIPGARFERANYSIHINSVQINWNRKTISYEDIQDILDRVSKKPGCDVIISYHKSNKKSRTLVKGEFADVEDGMIIDCHWTGAA